MSPVQGPLGLKGLLVAHQDVPKPSPGKPGVVLGKLAEEGLKAHAPVLRPVQKGLDGAGPGREGELLQDLLEEGGLVVLVVDHEAGPEAHPLPVDAEDPQGGGVEGGDPDLPRPRDQPPEALPHLLGGLVGEGDGQDLRGEDPPAGDEVGHPVDHGAGLPAPRPGHHQGGPLKVEDRLALGLVEGARRASLTGRVYHARGRL